MYLVNISDVDWIASTNIRWQGSQLLNPHLTVKCTRGGSWKQLKNICLDSYCMVLCTIVAVVPGGSRKMVQGSYLYYHYMQDGFDDNVRHSPIKDLGSDS